MTLIEKLQDLLLQATTERSHYYVASAVKEAIAEITRLETWIDDLQSEMYINCVYCGYRYGPSDEPGPMRAVLERHIESCPKHPQSAAKAEIERLTHLHNLDHSLADQWQKKNEAMLGYFIAAGFVRCHELPEKSAEFFTALGKTVHLRTERLMLKASMHDSLLALVQILIANAIVGPDAAMKGATDCYHVPLDDIDALKSAVQP
jgi:hypothetical protein